MKLQPIHYITLHVWRPIFLGNAQLVCMCWSIFITMDTNLTTCSDWPVKFTCLDTVCKAVNLGKGYRVHFGVEMHNLIDISDVCGFHYVSYDLNLMVRCVRFTKSKTYCDSEQIMASVINATFFSPFLNRFLFEGFHSKMLSWNNHKK